MKYSRLQNSITIANTKGGREYQEDCLIVAYNEGLEGDDDDAASQFLFIGVFDGHGGVEAAKYAKDHLGQNITSNKLFWSQKDKDVLKAIREGFLQTHNEMWQKYEQWPRTQSGFSSTSGTTASVAILKNGKIYIGHVGDSKIVLGEQDENDRLWKATPLTEDHKPESEAESQRIIEAGGKVVTKAGVPRVVWQRPRTGQGKGRQLRSTKTDEIPFLAIGRSLGDLWSYNISTGKFVVSPNPDVSVHDIIPSKHKCLIFGTDGLWNVVTPELAVNLVNSVATEPKFHSGKITNPSKLLMNEALMQWNYCEKRADNITVLTLMLADDDVDLIEEELRHTNGPLSSQSVTFIEQDSYSRSSFSSNCAYEDDVYETPDYQDISHMSVDECKIMQAVKTNPTNAVFPECVMQEINSSSATFERFNYA